MKRVIVIGADGFLGGSLALALAKKGYEVLALVFEGTRRDHLNGISNVKIVEYTFDIITDIHVDSYDTVFHMAWSGVSTRFKNDAYTQIQNVYYGIKVLEFAELNKIKRVLIPGSASEVSCGNGVITGNEIPAPSDFYSACKVATRFTCQTYARQHHIELIWMLITSIYGPGRKDDNLISYSIKSLLLGEKPSYTGLEQQWDYLYIDDLIEALILLGEKGKADMVYPVGSGEHRQLKEYVSIIREIIDPSLPIGIGELPYKSSIIDNQILDTSALRRDTGFVPSFSFEKGITKVIEEMKEGIH